MSESQQTVDGRTIGKRAMLTRRRLLDETARLLESHGVLGLKIVDVTRAVGTSPATFYQYFTDVDDAVLALATEVGDQELELVALISDAWAEPGGYELVVEFVDAFWRLWDAHRGVLRIRNLKSEEGDVRYIKARSRTSVPIAKALGSLVSAGVEAGRITPDLHPFATGGALLGMIERLFVYEEVFGKRGSTPANLRSTLATILYQTLVNHPVPEHQ